MKQINGYVGFGGKCREAMAFYQQCFGGELSLMTVSEGPMADQWPGDAQNDVMHACLVLPGDMKLMGSDGGCMASESAEGRQPLPHVTLHIECDGKEEIERLYAALSQGGNIQCPLGEQFWGQVFASFTDKLGVNWQLSCEKA